MFTPHWNDLLKADTWVMAMGQAFFSLSITGSGMIVYGSYLHKDENIPSASIWTGVFDTLAAMLAALAIIPAVFSFGIEPNCGDCLPGNKDQAFSSNQYSFGTGLAPSQMT